MVGIAGGKEKCEFAVKSLGFDACIDYKQSGAAVKMGLKEFCPDGVDVFFDSVGGEILDTGKYILYLYDRMENIEYY